MRIFLLVIQTKHERRWKFPTPASGLRPPAFTLIEMLLVLTIIIVIMGMSVPWIFREQVRSELKSAATQLQGDLYATRLTAMKTGEAYVFRFRGSSNVYEIMPKSVYDKEMRREAGGMRHEALEIDDSNGLAIPISSMDSIPNDTADASRLTPHTSHLPARLVFGVVQKPVQNTTQSMDDTIVSDSSDVPLTRGVGGEISSDLTLEEPYDFSGMGESTAAQSSFWSEPIVFFPNGRTSNASFELYTTGKYIYRVELNLRGLTGTARIGEIKLAGF